MREMKARHARFHQCINEYSVTGKKKKENDLALQCHHRSEFPPSG